MALVGAGGAGLFAALHASVYLLCDWGLWWLLELVRTHLDVQVSHALPPHLQLHVQGNGPLADMYKVSTTDQFKGNLLVSMVCSR